MFGMKNPVTPKYLDISTCHITREDALLLDVAGANSYPTVYKYPEGYFIHVPAETELLDEELNDLAAKGYSEALRNILRQANQAGCYFVRFDADGENYDDIPTFVW